MKNVKRFIHDWAWTIFIGFLGVGIFYPVIGVAALVCMLAPVVTAFFKGRMWCGNFCPRGSFNDRLLSKISRQVRIPHFFRNPWFRVGFLILLLSGFAVQFLLAWGSLEAIGVVLVRMIIITTLMGIALGVSFNQRAWCAICPMGTAAHYISKFKSEKKRMQKTAAQCGGAESCSMCSKGCPSKIDDSKDVA